MITIFIQILIIASTFIFCYFQLKPNLTLDEITKEWISLPYGLTDAEVERMIGKPKNVIDIDYEIDDEHTVYFEFKPDEGTTIKELIDRTPEPTMRIIHEGFSLSPLTSVITKEIPTKYHRC